MVEVTALVTGAAERCRVIGCTLVELAPERDPTGMSATVAARIALTMMGVMARS